MENRVLPMQSRFGYTVLKASGGVVIVRRVMSAGERIEPMAVVTLPASAAGRLGPAHEGLRVLFHSSFRLIPLRFERSDVAEDGDSARQHSRPRCLGRGSESRTDYIPGGEDVNGDVK